MSWLSDQAAKLQAAAETAGGNALSQVLPGGAPASAPPAPAPQTVQKQPVQQDAMAIPWTTIGIVVVVVLVVALVLKRR